MDESSLLLSTAEVSVAFAGFIGIFLALAAGEGRFPAADSFQIRLIVICSIAPVFLAVLPLILDLLGLGGSALWRLSSGVILLAEVAVTLYLVGQARALSGGEGRKLNYGFVLWVLASVACLVNAAGWPWPPSGGVYLVAVWSIVGIAAGNFVELLFRKLL